MLSRGVSRAAVGLRARGAPIASGQGSATGAGRALNGLWLQVRRCETNSPINSPLAASNQPMVWASKFGCSRLI